MTLRKLVLPASKLKLVELLFLPVVIEVVAILVGNFALSSYSGICGDKYSSPIPTIIIALIGLMLSIVLAVKVFRAGLYAWGILAVVLTLLVIFLGLEALVQFSLQFCF